MTTTTLPAQKPIAKPVLRLDLSIKRAPKPGRCKLVTQVVAYLGNKVVLTHTGLAGEWDEKQVLREIRIAPGRFRKGAAWDQAAALGLVPPASN